MATQKVHLQVALQKLACSYYMYIHLLCLRVKQDFRLVIELEIYLRGNARDAWGSSSFRDDLGLGKRRCGRTKLDSGRIVGHSEVIVGADFQSHRGMYIRDLGNCALLPKIFLAFFLSAGLLVCGAYRLFRYPARIEVHGPAAVRSPS